MRDPLSKIKGNTDNKPIEIEYELPPEKIKFKRSEKGALIKYGKQLGFMVYVSPSLKEAILLSAKHKQFSISYYFRELALEDLRKEGIKL